MFQLGDQVIYSAHGACCVVDLETRIIDRKKLTYLVLEPIGQGGSRYLVPTHNTVAMGKLRKILTPDQLESLMASESVRMDGWIPDENQRKQTYRELIGRGDRESIMRMVHSLYCHKASQSSAGKKIHQCDDNFLRDAERLLSGEIAIVMNMEYDKAKAFLREKLKA